MDRWTAEDCAKFIERAGFPQYKETFETNLTGSRLKKLKIQNLTQMNIKDHEHQRVIMQAIREAVAEDETM